MPAIQYVLRPSITRIIIPHLFRTVFLSLILVAIAVINLKFLGIELSTLIAVIIALFIVLIVIVDLLIAKHKVEKTRYEFYFAQIKYIGKKSDAIFLNQIGEIDVKRNIIDKLFGTATILIKPHFKMHYIMNYEQIVDYINKLIQYQYQFTQKPDYSTHYSKAVKK